MDLGGHGDMGLVAGRVVKKRDLGGGRRGGFSWPDTVWLEESLEPARDASGHGHRCKKPMRTGLSCLCC